MTRGAFIFVVQVLIFKGFSQQISYADKAADLGVMIYSDKVQVEKLDEFEMEYLNPGKIPLEDKEFHELVDAYIHWRFAEKRYRKYKDLGEVQSYLQLSTSFRNDTVNQMGMLNYAQYTFSGGLIDSTKFLAILDSVFVNSFHQTINSRIRNLKFHYRFASHIPDFEYLTIKNERIKLSGIEKKYILLDFWFKFCAPCIKAFPILDKINRTYSDLEIISIDPVDRIPWINEFLSDKDYSWHFVSIATERKKNSQFSEQKDFFNISVMPRYILINNSLEIIEYDLELKDLETYLDCSIPIRQNLILITLFSG